MPLQVVFMKRINRIIPSVILVLLVLFCLGFLAACGREKTDQSGNTDYAEELLGTTAFVTGSLSHSIAESPTGYYVMLKGLLHYIDKESKQATLLSAEGYSLKELLSNQELFKKSDAYFGEACEIFFSNHHVYVVSESYSEQKGNGRQIIEIEETGGKRKTVAEVGGLGESSCIYNGVFYGQAEEIDENAQRQSHVAAVDLNTGKITEFETISEKVEKGINLTIQTTIPVGDKIAFFSRNDKHDDILYLFDPDTQTGQGMVIGGFQTREGKECFVYPTGVYHNQLLMRSIAPVPEKEHPEPQFYLWNPVSDVEERFEKLPWPYIFISDGENLYETPTETTWISRAFFLGEDYDENRKVPLTIKDRSSGKVATIPDEWIEEKRLVSTFLSRTGSTIVYNGYGLFAFVEGDQVTKVSLDE